MRRGAASLALCACAVLASGPACARRQTAAPAPAAEPGRGEVTFTALVDVSAPRPPDSATEEIVPPAPIRDNQPPVYPPQPLAAGHGDATVVVRVVIDLEGRVAHVAPSPLEASTGGPFADDFRSAVEAAVLGWRFTPASHRTLKPGKDFDGDGKPDYRLVVRDEPIPVYLDLRFDFRIVNGEGVVNTAGASAP